MKNTITSIIFTVLLVIGIGIEIFAGVKIFKAQKAEETEYLIQYAMRQGQSNISVEEIHNFPEAPKPRRDGDVIAIDDNRFKIDGNMTDESHRSLGYIYYATLDTKESRLLTYEDKDSNLTEFHVALEAYLSGLPDALVAMLPVATLPENLTYYQQNYVEGVIPIIYDNNSQCYYMFLDCGTCYYIIYAKDTFYLTDSKLTVHYGNAAENPQRNHEYNIYEVAAVTNQRNQLTNGTYTGDPIQKGTAASASDTYSAKEDDNIRDMLVSYGKYKWLADGTSEQTRQVIDITSSEAKKSEWVLEANQFTYTANGLTVKNLSGKVNDSFFSIEGTVVNNIDAERAWVMCIKFLNRNGSLLGVRVIDNRSVRLSANGSTTFKVDLGASSDISIHDIYAVQFEVH